MQLRKGYTKTPVVCYSTSAEAHKGYGYNKDVNEEATDDADTDSDTSSHVEDGESQQSEDSNVSDKSGHGVEDDVSESSADENWVFDKFIDEIEDEHADNNEELSFKTQKKMFRSRYADFLVWYHHLRQNPIHKKIMETAKDLEIGTGDYSKEESLRAAVKQRHFLLDGILEDRQDPDSDNDEPMQK